MDLSKKIFVFPGQGSQQVGMGQEIYKKYDIAKVVFGKVDSVLQRELTKVVFEGPAELLNATHNSQPAIMATSIAILSVLLRELNINLASICSYVAGHSVGEYTALCASGSLPLDTVAKLLHYRGIYMQQACKDNPGSMAACLNVSREELEEVLKKLEGVCVIANTNSKNQIVISGQTNAVEEAVGLLKQGGVKVLPLKVAGAFHSPLMQDAEDHMRVKLEEVNFRVPSVPVVMNLNAKPTNKPSEILTGLTKQITSDVKWDKIMEFALERQLEIIEIGPGQVLGKLATRDGYPFAVKSICDLESLEQFIAEHKSS